MQTKTLPPNNDLIQIDLPTQEHNIDLGFHFGINTQNTEHLKYKSGNLLFELMGGINLRQLDRFKVTLKISRDPLLTPLHVYRSTLDLYNDGQIDRYVKKAAERLELGTSQINLPVYELIQNLEKYRIDKRSEILLPKLPEKINLTPKEKTAATKLSKTKELLPKISELLKEIGLIGEEDNGLLLFLIFLTRNFDYPLHGLIHGSSGSGKTNLLKTVINTVPEESKHITTALTENVLFYPPYREFWKRKILMLEDLDGSMGALLPLREFMSNQSIVKFVTEMDQQSGEHRQKKLEATGPVCIVGATTKEKIYEDNSNRSFLLHVDESKKQQEAVMDYQNALAAGLIDTEAVSQSIKLLQNFQRILEHGLRVVNPFQPELKLPQSVFKPLRTNQHYIQLIKAVTFLHQNQRKKQKDNNGKYFIETTLDDIAWANQLCRASFLRKSDELSGKERAFFEALKATVNKTEKESFFAKDIREAFRFHPQALKRNLNTLEKYHYITKVGTNRKMSYEYKINIWDDYSKLQEGMDVLDQKLKELRDNYPDA
jgi:DNA primase